MRAMQPPDAGSACVTVHVSGKAQHTLRAVVQFGDSFTHHVAATCIVEPAPALCVIAVPPLWSPSARHVTIGSWLD